MTDIYSNIDANYAVAQFLKQVYLVFGKDFDAWSKQYTVLVWTDYVATLRPDIQKFWYTYSLDGYMKTKGYITKEGKLTDIFDREVIC